MPRFGIVSAAAIALLAAPTHGQVVTVRVNTEYAFNGAGSSPSVVTGAALSNCSGLSSLGLTYVANAVNGNNTLDVNFGVDIGGGIPDVPGSVQSIVNGQTLTLAPNPGACNPAADGQLVRAVSTINAYSFAIGGGTIFGGPGNLVQQRATTEVNFVDTIRVVSPVAMQLILPVRMVVGGAVAESFGDPATTTGLITARVAGHVNAVPISGGQMTLESSDVIATTDALNVSTVALFNIAAGTNVIPVSILGEFDVRSSAQSAGFFGTLSGASTAAMNAPSGLFEIGYFQLAAGGSVPAGLVVTSDLTGFTYPVAVPEPGALSLILAASLVWRANRRRG